MALQSLMSPFVKAAQNLGGLSSIPNWRAIEPWKKMEAQGVMGRYLMAMVETALVVAVEITTEGGRKGEREAMVAAGGGGGDDC